MVHIYSLKEEYEIFKKTGKLTSNKSGCVLFKRIRELSETIELSESQLAIKTGEDYEMYVIRLQQLTQAMNSLFNYQDLLVIQKEFEFINSEVGVLETFSVSGLVGLILMCIVKSVIAIPFLTCLITITFLLFCSFYWTFSASLTQEQHIRINNLIELLKDHLRIYQEVIGLESVNTTSCEKTT